MFPKTKPSTSSAPSSQQPEPRVLLTGAYGFLGTHCVKKAIESGFRVRGTVRNFSYEKQLRKALGIEQNDKNADKLELIKLDLEQSSQEEWSEAMKGCDYCLHLATPVVTTYVSNPDTVLKPAVQGTEKVLRACAKARVRRVIFCSSTSAINAGHSWNKTHFTTKDWNAESPNGNEDKVFLYEKSKSLAEKQAFKVAAELDLDLISILPGSIWGPNILPRLSPCGEAIQRICNREVPMMPVLSFNCVDVRDVADLMIQGLTVKLSDTSSPKTKKQQLNRRFLAVAPESMDMKVIANICKDELGPYGWRPLTTFGPYAIFWLSSFFLEQAAFILPNIERAYTYDVENTLETFSGSGFKKFRSVRQAVADMVHSMHDMKMLDPSRKSMLVAAVKMVCGDNECTRFVCPSRANGG
ncbi:unnamed protein product [Amoebophrya sp. A120]|nr:unnamed protein product [Amoebophrya sp. A120]|eukprot:GSA120T00012520001.1